MNDTTMTRALAEAAPAIRTKIRMITYSRDTRSFSVYFADSALINRRFVATVENPNRIRLDEVDVGGSIVRVIGGAKSSNAAVFSMRQAMPAERKTFRQQLTIAPSWEHGKLSFAIDLPPIDPAAVSRPAPAADRMPRLDTLRGLLTEVRRLERETPYRLERGVDGTLEFVARVK